MGNGVGWGRVVSWGGEGWWDGVGKGGMGGVGRVGWSAVRCGGRCMAKKSHLGHSWSNPSHSHDVNRHPHNGPCHIAIDHAQSQWE